MAQQVTMLVKVSGSRDGVDWPEPGGSVEVPDVEAAALVAAGLGAVETPEDHQGAEITSAMVDTRPRARKA